MSTHPSLKSQLRLAKKSGVGQTTIGNWLRTDSPSHSPRLDALEKVAQAFGMSVSALLSEELAAQLPVAQAGASDQANMLALRLSKLEKERFTLVEQLVHQFETLEMLQHLEHSTQGL
jgi:transcriptional regulator with XRE-family HTH domain